MIRVVLVLAIAAVCTSPSAAQAILVDHTSVPLFEHIPPQYKEAAARLRLLFMDRSVGGNINDALSCLASPHDQAPSFCKRYEHRDPRYAVDPSEVWWDGVWDRSNWRYEFWPDGCSEDANCFIEAVEPRIDSFDVVGYQFSYLAVMPGSKLADPGVGFFASGGSSSKASDYAAFAARHPGKTVLWWTTSLARGIGTPESQAFNETIRDYARSHALVLFDVADILSHDPAGSPCFDNRDGVEYLTENYPDDGLDIPAICPQYTTETEGGHLGSISAGGIRVAKAFWVLMARIAGWDGKLTGIEPPAAQVPSTILLDVSPNPARDYLQLGITSPDPAHTHIRLTDLLGRTVAEPSAHLAAEKAARIRIDISDLPAGVYNLVVSAPGEQVVRSVVVAR